MRILFSSTSLAGHYGPLLPIARTFTALGHEVLFLVPGEARSAVEEAGFAVHEAPPPDPVEYQQIKDAIAEDPEAAKVLMNRDYFGRLCTEAKLPVAEELCATWKPDLVVHEAADYAPPIAAHRAGIAHVQIAIGLAWIEWGCLQTFAAEVLPAYEPDAIRIIAEAPYVTRFPETLDPSEYPQTVRYQAAEESSAQDSVESDLVPEGATLVYATLGSVVATTAFSPGAYRVLLDACALLERSRPEIRVLLTTGRALDPASLGAIPGNTRAEQWVPQDRAFAAAKAVLNHGGSGTAYGALSAGLPSVFFPLFSDQPHNAKLIAGAGAAIQIDTEDLRRHGMPVAAEPADRARLAALSEEIAEAVITVLDDASYAAKARDLGEELSALPSLETVVGAWSENGALRSNI
jgi:UDP:flavonoid glycosyltransferase YjiC (YdhE family)